MDAEPNAEHVPLTGGAPAAGEAPAEGVAGQELAGDDRAATIRRARKIGGLPGAVLAGALLGLKDVLDPPKDKQAVVVEASSEPHDIDKDGIDMAIDDNRRAVAKPLPPMAQHPVRVRRQRRRRHDH